MLQKISLTLAAILSLITSTLAHSGHNQAQQATGMAISNSSWMHGPAEMMGYNMWGMGWFGLLFGVAFWILIILAIIYLIQKIAENRGESE